MAGPGRQIGAKGKPRNTLLARIQKAYPNYHPIMDMCRTANDPDVSPELRFQASKEVSQYIAPKRKSVEISGEDGGPVLQHVTVSFRDD